MLINSENAMDYLVRCKEWIKQKALVPTMTSATTPSGVVTQSSIYNNNDGFAGWRAFNGILVGGSGTIWHSEASSNSWIQYEFPTNCKIKLIKIWDRNSDNIQGTYNVNFKRSSDGEVIKSFSYSPTNNGVHEIVVDNDNNGNICRLEYTNPASPNNYTIIAELQFYGEQGVTDNENAMQLIGANDYASNLLLSDEDWLEGICNSEYFEDILNIKVPTMTSATAPSGEVITSSNVSGFDGYKAFDNNASTSWRVNSNVLNGSYIIYHFTSQVRVNKVVNNYRTGSSSVVKFTDWELYGSNDNVSYTDIGEINANGDDANVINILANSNKYSYYKLVCKSASASGTSYGFAILQFYGRPNGGVQSWLLSAGITNKSYTSLSEVFSDTETLRALLNNHDAVYYLTTVPGWATEFAANENAMKYIGANDYASDILLANEEWVNAIVNSTYYTEILNAAVPTMTSNTTPEGECFGDVSGTGHPLYYAFDGNDSTAAWVIQNAANKTIGYKFTRPVKICNVYAKTQYNYGFKLQGSNDGINYIDIDIELTSNSSGVYANGVNVNDYLYYRFMKTDYSSSTNATIYTIQFYGREFGGVQSWLLAAGITNKNYTTVSQVLADSDLLPVLIASHSGMDYLATCVVFANEICANETAMQLIGADNYASDALLSNETWIKAIANSTYTEYVLNVKVPTMTSATTPSGEAIGTYYETLYPWKAFNGITSSDSERWSGDSSFPQYVGYGFTSSCKVYVFSVMNRTQTTVCAIKNFVLQGSNDNSTWTDIQTYENLNNEPSTVFKNVVTSAQAFQYFRLMITSINNGTRPIITELQFYGRQDV